jgi:hypothetical protein
MPLCRDDLLLAAVDVLAIRQNWIRQQASRSFEAHPLEAQALKSEPGNQGRKSLPIMPGCSMQPREVRRCSRDFAVRGSSCAPALSSPLR